ncbi:unnamed protein product [Effrenium voratum]|nr:unnamed protein product [Effrenium voratum]
MLPRLRMLSSQENMSLAGSSDPSFRNPGSLRHNTGCKPCNKFKPERPESCKKGDTCTFCHEEHERPKHKGHRGRFRRSQGSSSSTIHPELANIGARIYQEKTMRFLAGSSSPSFGNPGSLGHNRGCRPCGSFKPERPESCKKGDTCTFCHWEHERPKHKGQRGRFALQRRQCLESVASQGSSSSTLAQIGARIYEETPIIVERLKRLVKKLRDHSDPSSTDWAEKVQFLGQEIWAIGNKAQDARPDSSRVQKARHEQPPRTNNNADLESRRKWYEGRLYLTAKKMFESERLPVEDVWRLVDTNLRELEDLEKKLDQQIAGSAQVEPPRIATADAFIQKHLVQNSWLLPKLLELLSLEVSDRLTEKELKEMEAWNHFHDELQRLPEITDPSVQSLFNAAASLEALKEAVTGELDKRLTILLPDQDDDFDKDCA